MDRSASAQVLHLFANGPTRTDVDAKLPLFTSGATDPHAASLATPVFGAGQKLMGALIVSGPASRLTAERAQQIRAILLDEAAKLTLACGGTPIAPPAKKFMLRRKPLGRKSQAERGDQGIS
jgi:hypothetical protein